MWSLCAGIVVFKLPIMIYVETQIDSECVALEIQIGANHGIMCDSEWHASVKSEFTQVEFNFKFIPVSVARTRTRLSPPAPESPPGLRLRVVTRTQAPSRAPSGWPSRPGGQGPVSEPISGC